MLLNCQSLIICYLGIPFIKSLFHSKIVIFYQLMAQNLSKLARMPKYENMFLTHYSANLCPIWIKFYVRVQETSSDK